MNPPQRTPRPGRSAGRNGDERHRQAQPEVGLGASDAWTGGPGHAPEQRADEELVRAAMAALAMEPSVDPNNFHVEVDGGTVRLHGSAHTNEELTRAIKAVETVAGVERVEAHVQVVQS